MSTQPVDKTVSDSDGPQPVLFNQTQSKSSFSGDVYNLSPKDVSKERDESVGTSGFSSSLESRGSSNEGTVNNRPEVVPFSNTDKQSSGYFDQNDVFPKATSPFSESTLLSTSMQMDGFLHGSGLIKGTFFSYGIGEAM